MSTTTRNTCVAETRKTPLRICILGGGGYLGQTLAKALQKCGHFVVILDLQFQKFPHIVHAPKMLHFIQGSILDTQKLFEALKDIHSCFHLAGYGMTGGASLNRHMTMRVNYDGTLAVLDACKRLCVRHLIYASSISVVYREEEMHNSDETEPYSSKFANPYAESKCLAEKAVIAANNCTTASKIHTCALRFRGIYGPGELRTTQRTVNLGLSGLIVAKFRKSASPRTQYSNAENCVNALILAEQSLRTDGLNSIARAQVYNIVDGGEPVDTFEFWDPLIRSVGGRIPNVYLPFWLVYAAATLFEILYHVFGVEPLFTRFEANLMAVTNTFSVEKARRELNYRPVQNHDLSATIEFCKQQRRMKTQKSLLTFASLLGTVFDRVIEIKRDVSHYFFKSQSCVGCAIDFVAMLITAQMCSTLFREYTLTGKIFANLFMLLIYFGIVAIRYNCRNVNISTVAITQINTAIILIFVLLLVVSFSFYITII